MYKYLTGAELVNNELYVGCTGFHMNTHYPEIFANKPIRMAQFMQMQKHDSKRLIQTA